MSKFSQHIRNVSLFQFGTSIHFAECALRGYELFPLSPYFILNFEKLILRFYNVIKLCVVNKLTIVNSFVLHILLQNITHLAIITRNTTENL